MRNRFAGKCYVCGKTVEPQQGHFERYHGKWRVQHKEHANNYPKIKDPLNIK